MAVERVSNASGSPPPASPRESDVVSASGAPRIEQHGPRGHTPRVACPAVTAVPCARDTRRTPSTLICSCSRLNERPAPAARRPWWFPSAVRDGHGRRRHDGILLSDPRPRVSERTGQRTHGRSHDHHRSVHRCEGSGLCRCMSVQCISVSTRRRTCCSRRSRPAVGSSRRRMRRIRARSRSSATASSSSTSRSHVIRRLLPA